MLEKLYWLKYILDWFQPTNNVSTNKFLKKLFISSKYRTKDAEIDKTYAFFLLPIMGVVLVLINALVGLLAVAALPNILAAPIMFFSIVWTAGFALDRFIKTREEGEFASFTTQIEVDRYNAVGDEEDDSYDTWKEKTFK